MGYPNVNAFSLVLIGLILFSAVSFLAFGLSCFFSSFMVTEFERYHLPKFRKLNGFLQLFGGLGLLFGFFYPFLGIIASLGLGILMALGFLVRLKIKDGFTKSFPAFFYMIINFIICFLLWKN